MGSSSPRKKRLGTRRRRLSAPSPDMLRSMSLHGHPIDTSTPLAAAGSRTRDVNLSRRAESDADGDDVSGMDLIDSAGDCDTDGDEEVARGAAQGFNGIPLTHGHGREGSSGGIAAMNRESARTSGKQVAGPPRGLAGSSALLQPRA